MIGKISVSIHIVSTVILYTDCLCDLKSDGTQEKKKNISLTLQRIRRAIHHGLILCVTWDCLYHAAMQKHHLSSVSCSFQVIKCMLFRTKKKENVSI